MIDRGGLPAAWLMANADSLSVCLQEHSAQAMAQERFGRAGPSTAGSDLR